MSVGADGQECAAAIAAARREERERCAQIVKTRRKEWPFDKLDGQTDQGHLRQWLADQIMGDE